MTTRLTLLIAFALPLMGCSEPEPEPVQILEAPSFDKLGNPVCPEGYSLATTETGEPVCAGVVY
ncbi:hypothetical protein KBY25_08285 [Ruegeria pomeroyi]|nr:hypothetical protein [Ruegeria pomeroyi]